MTASNAAGENPGDPNTSEKTENISGPPKAFLEAIEAFQKGAAAGNSEQMEAAALNALAVAAEEEVRNPTPSVTLKTEAGECMAQGDWAGAEAKYRNVLALEEASGNHGLIFKAHYDLSRLFNLLGDLERAFVWARTATDEARKAHCFPVLVMGLVNQANCALKRLEHSAALEAASEAVAIVEPGRMYESMRAGALVVRARCHLALNDIASAETDLAVSRPVLLDRQVSLFFAGANSRAAEWWEATAEVCSLKGDVMGACDAWAEAVKIRRNVASLMHVAGPGTRAALAHSLRRLSESLQVAGKQEEGPVAMAEAQHIWAELGLPHDNM
jgi:tetratricopeptide (TPR) repeat protein